MLININLIKLYHLLHYLQQMQESGKIYKIFIKSNSAMILSQINYYRLSIYKINCLILKKQHLIKIIS